jgi:predicted ATPase/class 3 adenylate cyclase
MTEDGPAVTTAPQARTATFLMTDIEGSTRLWSEQRAAMAVALEAHDALLRTAVEQAGGWVVKTTGDGLLAAFDRPEAALTAAVEGQRALDHQGWAETGPLRVRMAINSGSADVRDGDYFGPALNRVARLMAIGHGGQVLVSDSTRALVVDDLAPPAELIDQGEHRLRDLDRAEHVYQLAAPGLRREFPPLRTTAEHPTNLRPQVTSFVGRERELADVGRLLARSRLVTLVGVGGTGKTRLELQAAADALERYGDGAWLVELAPLSDPELVVSEIGRALGVQLEPGRRPIDTVVDYLRSKELLLLLDNCEHLIAAAADITYGLLGNCPSVAVLATSREPLGVDGEAVFSVPSLTLPDRVEDGDARLAGDAQLLALAGQSEAVRLFVERATATLPSFSLDPSNVQAVVEICRRLDGIPLALELAAARVNVLSADEIAQGLGDRFRLLTGGRRTAVPRQRTLQALIDWSWDLLDDEDRQLLRRLAVFSGGWTLDTAAAVAFENADERAARFAAIDGLGRLVDRSLVVVEHEGSTRYRMLETIRQYAADQLAQSGETVALRDRHLSVLLRLAQEAEQGLAGPESPAWLKRLDSEVDNVRSALDWALETRPEAGLEICVTLARYWQSRTMGSEGYDRLMQAVGSVRALPEAESAGASRARSSLIARALSSATILATMGGRSETLSLGEEAVVAARESGDPAALADALYVRLFRAEAYAPPGHDGDWRPAAEEARVVTTGLGDWGRLSRLELGLAMIEARQDPAVAESWLQRASEAAHRSGNPQEIAYLAQIRGRLASLAGRQEEAQRWFREAQARFAAIDDRRFALSSQSELGHALRRDGRLEEAETEYRQSIRGWQRTGNRGAVANQLESFAFVALARGQGLRAARLLGAADALREVSDAQMTSMERAEYDAEMLRLRQLLDEGTFGSAWAEGHRMTADDAVALALAE